MRPTHELLYDSEASLRLVDRAIGDLSPANDEDRSAEPAVQQRLQQVQESAHNDVDELDSRSHNAAIVVRFCKDAGMLDDQGGDTLTNMPGRLREVSARTETATTDILDGLGRAVALVNAIDGAGGLTDEARHAMATSLRDELNLVTHHLQFQDITSQQLADVAALFADMRSRIAQVVSIFAPPAAVPTQAECAAAKDEAQALADEIFSLQAVLKSA